MKLFNFIYEAIIQCWVLLVITSIFYGVGLAICELILMKVKK